jgi:hypothetical protein
MPSTDRPPLALPLLALALLVTTGLAGSAEARSEKTLAYPRDQAWPTAVRFLVVDEHLRITEKDAESGYVLFELREEGRVFRGSLEVVTVSRDGRTAVRFVLQIADRPSWLEIAMLTRLERKLRAELGSPTPAPDAPAKKDEPKKDEPKKDEPRPGSDDGLPISPTP